MKKAKELLYLGLLLFAFFPIIPNKIKGLPVVVLFAISIFLFLKSKSYKINLKKVLIYSSLYILYIISLLYTSDFHRIDKTLTTRLSLLVFPLILGLMNTTIKKITLNQLSVFLRMYFVLSTIYCILIFIFFYQIGFLSQKVNIDLYYSHLAYEMWSIGQHPIYASIFIGIAMIFALELLFLEKKKSFKALIFIGLFILTFTLFFLARKGVILGVIIAAIIFLVKRTNSRKNIKFIIGSILTIGIMFLICSPSQKRFKEIINSSSYGKVDESNSTSVRIGIYKCVLNKILERPILGHGIGDTQNELRKCYSKTSDILLYYNHNSHNQFLSIWLSNGIIGVIVFIIFLLINFKKAIREGNLLFLSLLILFSIVMLFENILEKQSGVILFSLVINFFAFIKIEKDINKN